MKLNQRGAFDLLLIAALFLIMVVGTFVVLRVSESDDEAPKKSTGAVTNFEECVAAGNFIMESYPRQCAADGQTFVEDISDDPVVNDSNVYTSQYFDYEFEIPDGVEVGEERRIEGYEGAGYTSFIDLGDIQLSARTTDYSVGPKGPIPFSGVTTGYTSTATGVSLNENYSRAELEEYDTFVYVEVTETFGDDVTEYIALFNLQNGVLVLTVDDQALVDDLIQFAETVYVPEA